MKPWIAWLFAIICLFAASIDFTVEQPQPVETIAMSVETTELEPEPILARESPEVDLETWTVTAYCACDICCPGTSDNLTTNMSTPLEGVTIAADPSIPFGTRIWIEVIGERTVMDRGSAITGNHIDVYFADHNTARDFGVQKLKVQVIE